jgi:integrase
MQLSDAWQRCLNAYLTTIEDRSGSVASRRTYASTLYRFLANRDPAAASRADVLDFLQSVSTSNRNHGLPVAASTKNSRRAILSSFYRFAQGYVVDEKPLFEKPLPTLGTTRLKPDVAYHTLTADELDRLFAAIPTDTVKGLRDRAIFLTYFWTARRRSEIIRLHIRDIEPTVIDGRSTHVYLYRAKGTSRTMRTAELPTPAWNAIDAYLSASGRTLTPDSYVFVSVHPGQGYKDGRTNVPLNPDYTNKMFKEHLANAGIDAGTYSLHSLRHASARARYAAGEDIRSIQHVLGHASLATTDTYLRILVPIEDKGAQLLQERFGDL